MVTCWRNFRSKTSVGGFVLVRNIVKFMKESGICVIKSNVLRMQLIRFRFSFFVCRYR